MESPFSLNGQLYLYATPGYDPSTRSLTFSSVEYDENTRKLILKLAPWLLGAGLDDAMKKGLSIPIGVALDGARDDVAHSLNGPLSTTTQLRRVGILNRENPRRPV